MKYSTLSHAVLSVYTFLDIVLILIMGLATENHAIYHISFRGGLALNATIAILKHGSFQYDFYLKLFFPVLLMISYISFCWVESFSNFKWVLTTLLDILCWTMVNGLIYKENREDE